MTLETFNKYLNKIEDWLVRLIKYKNDINRFPIIKNNNCTDVLSVLYLEYYDKKIYESLNDIDHLKASLTISLNNIFSKSKGKYVYDLTKKGGKDKEVLVDDIYGSTIQNKNDEDYIYYIDEDEELIDEQYNALDEWINSNTYNKRFYEIYSRSYSITQLSKDLNTSYSSANNMINKMKMEIHLLGTTNMSYNDIVILVDNNIRKEKDALNLFYRRRGVIDNLDIDNLNEMKLEDIINIAEKLNLNCEHLTKDNLIDDILDLVDKNNKGIKQ